jgi:hypothetical protein
MIDGIATMAKDVNKLLKTCGMNKIAEQYEI